MRRIQRNIPIPPGIAIVPFGAGSAGPVSGPIMLQNPAAVAPMGVPDSVPQAPQGPRVGEIWAVSRINVPVWAFCEVAAANPGVTVCHLQLLATANGLLVFQDSIDLAMTKADPIGGDNTYVSQPGLISGELFTAVDIRSCGQIAFSYVVSYDQPPDSAALSYVGICGFLTGSTSSPASFTPQLGALC